MIVQFFHVQNIFVVFPEKSTLTAKLERDIAMEIITNENNVENNVTKNLALLLENNIATIQKHKRVVHKLQQDNESAKHKHQVSQSRLIISSEIP